MSNNIKLNGYLRVFLSFFVIFLTKLKWQPLFFLAFFLLFVISEEMKWVKKILCFLSERATELMDEKMIELLQALKIFLRHWKIDFLRSSLLI